MDKLMLVPVLARTIASALFRLATSPFIGGAKASTLFKDVAFAALRTNLSIISPNTEQFANPTTDSIYLDFAKKEGFQPDTDVLSSGLKLHWLGGKAADKVLLYFHGGGYAMSVSPGHMKVLFEVQNEVAKSHSFAVVVVAYTLSPYGAYPTQLKQAAESLEWLLQDQKKKPSDVGYRTLLFTGYADHSLDLHWRRLSGRQHGPLTPIALVASPPRRSKQNSAKRTACRSYLDIALGQICNR